MRKALSVFLTLYLVLSLSACRADIVAIEDHEWKLRAVMHYDVEGTQNEDELVVAVGEADEVYPEAEIVNITMVAQNGAITVIDATSNKTYTGSYKLQRKTSKSMEYEMTIDGVTGYATVAPTVYYGCTEIPTLPINLGGYSLYFIPVEREVLQ